MVVSAKDQAWKQVFDQVARTTDARGRRIDRVIMGLVHALNAHGVRTTGSCEGHLDHGLAYPWVWISREDQGKLSRVLSAFNRENEEEGYEAMDRMLVIVCNFIDEVCVLQSFGAACQNEREPSLKATKLQEYQHEMQSFADFLKVRFFANA